jgi:hypothetical protein
MQLNAKLHKRHTMLSFHREQEAIAAHILANTGDIQYTQIKERLKSLLFWRGDTANLKTVQEE